MDEKVFKDKFIAFVDILGFKQLVAAAEAGTGMGVDELLGLVRELGSAEDGKRFEKYGPMVCPGSNCTQRNLDFQVAQVSDCVVVSSEVSPAGLINLVSHCWGAVIKLLTKGVMCRGYITRGTIYHNGMDFIGSGYQKALAREPHVSVFKRVADERGTPFVEVDSVVCDYIEKCGDVCIKEMFSRFVKTDGEVTALFPFQRLSHSFIIAGPGISFDPQKELESNENMRHGIEQLIERVMALVDTSNPRAVDKAEHYVGALKAQLELCSRTDDLIKRLCSPVPRTI